jgi:hypothetical protein
MAHCPLGTPPLPSPPASTKNKTSSCHCTARPRWIISTITWYKTRCTLSFLYGSFECLTLQIPPATERPDTNVQTNTPTPTQYTNAAIPDCSCQRCSDAQRRQSTWYPTERGDPQHVSVSVLHIVNKATP